MTDREKVTAGLERLKDNEGCMNAYDDYCKTCPYAAEPGCCNAIITDALTLLKAQEPHVIQFDEIDDYEVLWLEVRDVETEDGLAPWIKTASGRWFSPLFCTETCPDMILSTPREYGKTCRCWTSRPTKEQTEAVKWE